MLGILSKLIRPDAGLKKLVLKINELEPEIQKLSDEEILEASGNLKDLIQKKIGDRSGELREILDDHLPRAFALVRETARRTLTQRHFDVQLMGGIALHQGKIAEMKTGEGKTLAATLPAYLNALSGKGVHVVTVNEYLAKRDTVWMGQIYHALGLSAACLVHEGAFIYDPDFTGEKSEILNPKSETKSLPKEDNVQNSKHKHKESALLDKERDATGSFIVQTEYLRPVSRSEAYQADITYGTNHEFGFDYLRDNLAYNPDQQVQRREYYYAIIDEVDSILIDEARTPLIISAPDAESSQFYKVFSRLVSGLEKKEDYLVDEKARSVDITDQGIDKIENDLKVNNLYAPENLRLVHYLEESLKAKELYLRDRDYVVKDGEIIIVDQFTGRLMPGRRYSGGLHQAIEAKEGVAVKQESRTVATISIQNYFRLYSKLAGMTGTAQTSAEEFHKVYNLEVISIPTNKPMVRTDLPDLVYKTRPAKYQAIIEDVKKRHERGQPVLIGTVSIEKNEELSGKLREAGLRHEVLNAKNNEREGAIIAEAGRPGAITVATNMAGRGVDIMLGGPVPGRSGNHDLKSEIGEKNSDISDEYGDWQKDRERVIVSGGLHVIGTERHESRRIDNQLRGRSGRQGDCGSSQFFLSLEDDLMRIFGGDRIRNLMQTLKIPDETPIQAGMINKVISQAQSRVEGMNFDARKHLLEYDDVLNKQRFAIYRKRKELLASGRLEISESRLESGRDRDEEKRKAEVSFSPPALPAALSALDMFWMHHLENMEALRESVGLRAYGQHDPLVEYRREGHLMYQKMVQGFEQWIRENAERLTTAAGDYGKTRNQNVINQKPSVIASRQKVGRNDPCPCGAINAATGQIYKWKKCGMINAPHHKNKQITF